MPPKKLLFANLLGGIISATSDIPLSWLFSTKLKGYKLLIFTVANSRRISILDETQLRIDSD